MVLASLAVGALVAQSPIAAAALLVVGAAAAIAVGRPELLFAAGIIILAVEPARIFGASSTAGQPEAYKLVLYACTLPLLAKRGMEWRKCAPIGAYLLVTVLTELFGTPWLGLTPHQTAASLATLCLAWLVFGIDWDWRRDQRLLKVLVWTPIVSLLMGVALYSVGVISLLTTTPPPRLEGATIVAWLGTISACAVMACIVLHRREQWRWAPWLGLVDAAILGGTLTRGAVLALGIAIMPMVARFVRSQLLAKGTSGLARLMVVVVVAAVGGIMLVSGLQERNELATTHITGQGGERDISSGRIHAWAFAYEQAKANILFGRGVGSGPLVGKSSRSPAGFVAQHNEYVRMLLETGIVGSAILLATMAGTMFRFIRRAPSRIRADLAAGAIAFAIYSITENTFSALPLAVAFLMFFGIAGSRVPLSRAGPGLEVGCADA